MYISGLPNATGINHTHVHTGCLTHLVSDLTQTLSAAEQSVFLAYCLSAFLAVFDKPFLFSSNMLSDSKNVALLSSREEIQYALSTHKLQLYLIFFPSFL